MGKLDKKEAPKLVIEELQGKAGFKPSARLVDQLRKKFPERKYYDAFGQFGMDEDSFSDLHITRVARVKRKIAVILVGESENRAFRGDHLFVDPKFAAHRIGEKLIRSIFADHNSFTLEPYPLSKAPGLEEGFSRDNRESALRAYYGRMGFEFTSGSEMKWTRK